MAAEGSHGLTKCTGCNLEHCNGRVGMKLELSQCVPPGELEEHSENDQVCRLREQVLKAWNGTLDHILVTITVSWALDLCYMP